MRTLDFPCIVADGGGGLAVYASRRIRAGERILMERPLVLTISHEARSHICTNCLADSRSTGSASNSWSLVCEECGTQRYCSQQCMAAQAARHRGIECAALARAAAAPLEDDDIDTVAQFIRILADRNHGWQADAGPPGVVGVGNAHAERLVGVTPSTDEARTALRRIAAATLALLPKEVRIPSSELVDLLERHGCNLYGVTGAAGEDVAGASFVGFFHLFNHACCPNVVFDSARQVMPATAEGQPPCFALLALEDIAEGTELNISYTSSADGPAQRSEHLREYYGFECACSRCMCGDIAAELDFADALEAKRCTREECGSGLSVPSADGAMRCVHCGGEWEPDE